MSRHPFKDSGQAPPSCDPDQLLTFTQGCEILKMSPRWVGMRVKDGTLPHLRCGKSIRFRRSALVEWCARREQGGPPK